MKFFLKTKQWGERIEQPVLSTDGKARIIVQHLQEYSQQKFRLDFLKISGYWKFIWCIYC